MIELNNHRSLSFQVPEILPELRRCTEQHLEQLLPKVLNQNRLEAFAAMVEREFHDQRTTEAWRAKARETLKNLSQAELENAFRAETMEQFERHCGKGDLDLNIEFQRTLRIPDDDKEYPLPAGLGPFPMHHIDDYEERLPDSWLRRGGVIMPMYQSEALWINFTSGSLPFAIKIASGKINALTGKPWSNDLTQDPQNYMVSSRQPWLDGFAVEEGIIRQFVAMPLGEGYSVEEQLTGEAEFGGLQLQVYPMKTEYYFENTLRDLLPSRIGDCLDRLLPPKEYEPSTRLRDAGMVCFSAPMDGCSDVGAMGLGAGGRMRQEIYRDPYPMEAWDMDRNSRCFVHLCNSMQWRQVTGSNPPHPPITSAEYRRAGMPWFDHYRDDLPALPGSEALDGVKTVAQLTKEKQLQPLVGNESMDTPEPVQLGPGQRPRPIREFSQ